MKYVTSDIHGDKERFHALLEKIHFSKDDTLYILGDVIDRGPDGIELLLEIMRTPNMVLIIGNHELTMVRAITSGSILHYAGWTQNGGEKTYHSYFQLNYLDRRELKLWLGTLPSFMEVDVQGKQWYLVHAFPGEDVYARTWTRPEINDSAQNWIGDKNLVIGHTPVIHFLVPYEEQDEYEQKLVAQGKHLEILKAPHFYAIDCGCGHDTPVTRLAALRLDDMEAFYV